MFKEQYDTAMPADLLVELAANRHAPPVSADALQAGFFQCLLDEIDHGLLVVNDQAAIVYANQLAQQEIQAGNCLSQQAGRLIAKDAAQDRLLRTALANTAFERRCLIKMGQGEGLLTLSIVPLRDAAAASRFDGVNARVLIVFGKRDVCDVLTLRHYGQLHHLSGAEQALLPDICRGLKTEDMADQHHVSPHTIRAHLKHIREKFGVNSLRVVVARLATLPPIRCALKPALTH